MLQDPWDDVHEGGHSASQNAPTITNLSDPCFRSALYV